MADGVTGGTDLTHMPAWATAVVVAMMVILSGFLEFMVDKFTQLLQKPRWSWLSFLDLEEPFEKIKSEFMLMGFMYILLNLLKNSISNICIGQKAGHIILPCNNTDGVAAGPNHCLEKGKVALTSPESIEQLHTFMLVLGVVHVIYSLVAMALARFRMKSWKKWETSAQGQSTTGITERTVLVLPNAHETRTMRFLRRFSEPINKEDYLVMRGHFIVVRNSLQPGQATDFYEYITSCFKKDTKVSISMSLSLRVVAVITVLLNIHGKGTLFWISFVPLVILLVVEAKLVKVYGDKFRRTGPSFWFNQPGIIRFLIRLAMFENAFIMAHFLWGMGTPVLRNCYYKNLVFGIMGAVLGITFQIFCGCVTLPLYAIVTKMPKVIVNRDEESIPNDTAENDTALLVINSARGSTSINDDDKAWDEAERNWELNMRENDY